MQQPWPQSRTGAASRTASSGERPRRRGGRRRAGAAQKPSLDLRWRQHRGRRQTAPSSPRNRCFSPNPVRRYSSARRVARTSRLGNLLNARFVGAKRRIVDDGDGESSVGKRGEAPLERPSTGVYGNHDLDIVDASGLDRKRVRDAPVEQVDRGLPILITLRNDAAAIRRLQFSCKRSNRAGQQRHLPRRSANGDLSRHEGRPPTSTRAVYAS